MSAMHGLSAEQIAVLVRGSRAAQGLPERVTDPLALRDVSVLLVSVTRARRVRARGKVA